MEKPKKGLITNEEIVDSGDLIYNNNISRKMCLFSRNAYLKIKCCLNRVINFDSFETASITYV